MPKELPAATWVRGGLVGLICCVAGRTHAEESPGAFLRQFRAVHVGLAALSYSEDTSWKEEWPGKPPLERHRTVRVLFRADLGKVRREPAGPDAATAAAVNDPRRPRPGPSVRALPHAPPSWLAGIAEALARNRVTLRRDHGLTIADLRKPKAPGDGVAARITFNGDRLPIGLVTFDGTGAPLDELGVRWQRVRGRWFPLEARFVYHSREDTLTKTVTYRDVVIDPLLSATLFSVP